MAPADPTTPTTAAPETGDVGQADLYDAMRRAPRNRVRRLKFRGHRRKRSSQENLVEATVKARAENNRTRPKHRQLTTNPKKVRGEVRELVKRAQDEDHESALYIPV